MNDTHTEIDKPRRAMVVVAHPDDGEYGCSGTVAKWTREGWEVVYVLCTDGSKGTEDYSLTSADLVRIRETEQLNAGKVLGLKDVAFLRHPDGYLQPSLELRKDITRQIRIHKPHIIITMNPRRDLMIRSYLGHPDHFAAGEATLSAVYPAARDHFTFPELYTNESLEPWKVEEVWVMMFGEEANRWNPLTEEDMDKSVAALMEHKSQISDPENSGKWMRERRREAGESVGAPYAESFRVFVLR